MHEYYEKNLNKYEKDFYKNLSLISDEIEEFLNVEYAKIERESWEVFKNDMLEKFPYIGDMGNVSNLIMGYSLISFGVICKRYGLSIEKWGLLASKMVERMVDRVPKIIRFIVKNIIKLPFVRKKFLPKQSRISKENAKNNPKAFISEVSEETDEYFIVYNYLQCPLNEFAKEHGYTEFMPYVCNTDYITAQKFGIALERYKTCSKGDGCCDFRVRKNGKPHSYWPPHILDDKDPLN